MVQTFKNMANHFLLFNPVVDNTIEKSGPAKAISDNAMHWNRKRNEMEFYPISRTQIEFY